MGSFPNWLNITIPSEYHLLAFSSKKNNITEPQLIVDPFVDVKHALQLLNAIFLIKIQLIFNKIISYLFFVSKHIFI